MMGDVSEERWSGRIDFFTPKDPTVPYMQGMQITEGMRVRLPGGGMFEVMHVRKDDKGRPPTMHLTLEPVPDNHETAPQSED